jgi:DNA-binding GntR family transcriptional regulator
MDAIETEKIVTTAEMFEIVGNELKEKNAEIERLRTNQSIIIALFRIYMIRLNPDYSEEEFDKHIANLSEEKE